MTEQSQPRQPDELDMDFAIGAAAAIVMGNPEQRPEPTVPEALALPEVVMSKAEWHQQAETEIKEALETNQPLSFLMIDINGFKGINDEIDHDTGDRVIDDLKGLFALFAESFRTEHDEKYPDRPLDLVSFSPPTTEEVPLDIDQPGVSRMPIPGHIGGDEFAVMLHTDEVGSKAVIERLRTQFDQYINDPANAQLKELNVGMAIGAAYLRPTEAPLTEQVIKTTKSAILTEADEAMYFDKIDQIEYLDEEDRRDLRTIMYLTKKLGEKRGAKVRVRDLPKYVEKLNFQDKELESEA